MRATEALASAGAPDKTRLWAMIETPLAILNVRRDRRRRAAGGARLACFVMGTNDLVKETRADLSANRRPALYWLSATVTAARAYGLDVLDGVYNNFKDADGFRRECVHGRALGFDGKTLIHPDQIAVANEVFAPPRGRGGLGREDHRRLRSAGEQGQGRHHRGGPHGRAAARRDGAAHGGHRRGHRGRSMKLYRYLTGPDDDSFCHRVTAS